MANSLLRWLLEDGKKMMAIVTKVEIPDFSEQKILKRIERLVEEE